MIEVFVYLGAALQVLFHRICWVMHALFGVQVQNVSDHGSK